jgi:peptidoglycan hydrolase-like protein with peptidoglycan-binding domain
MTNRSRTARTAWFTGLLVVATVGAGAAGVAAAPATTPPTDPAPTDTAAAPAPPDTAVAPAPAAPAATALPAGVVLPPAPVLPSNVEAAAWAAQEIPAVGSKSGEKTKLVQQRLLDLGFWNSGADGKYGFATTQAVMAFQKYNGLNPTGSVDKNTAFALTFATEKAHGQTTAGNVVEVDKARQVLFIVQDGKTVWAFNTSTGSGIAYEATNHKDPTKTESGDAQTPNGLYMTNRERPEGWWEGDLGQIYRPKYFNGGIAVHGMTSVPNHPASHGCVRLSTQAMDMIWDTNLIPLHTTVWVHE